MSDYITFLFGFGLSAVIIYMLLSKVGDDHPFLKYILMIMLLVIGMFIPTIVAQSKMNCEVVPVNSTTVGSLSTYNYDQVCFEFFSDIPITFYTVMTYFYYGVIFYLLIFNVVVMLKNLILYLKTKRYGK